MERSWIAQGSALRLRPRRLREQGFLGTARLRGRDVLLRAPQGGRLGRHQTGIMKGMSQDRNALHGGKQVHGKAVGVFPLPECPKLALDPGHVLSGDLGRSGGERAARLVELGAKRPDRAAALCQEILILGNGLDAGAKPILGRSSFVPSLPLRGQIRQPLFNDRLANLVLGFEVIIDIAQRNLGFACDVGKRGGAEAVLVHQVHGRTHQPRSFIDMCPSHVCA